MESVYKRCLCNTGLRKIRLFMILLTITTVTISLIMYGSNETTLNFKQKLIPSDYPTTAGKVDVFQKIKENFTHFYIFNAFDDFRSHKGLIRILALGDPHIKPPLFCHIKFSNKTIISPADTNYEWILPNHQHMRVAGFFIRCQFYSSIDPPLSVSLSTSSEVVGSNLVRIRRIPRFYNSSQFPTTAACVAPLHGHIKVSTIAEWIETYRLLGVSHFTFYNFSITPETSRLLRHYQQRDLVTVVPWNGSSIPFSTFQKGGHWPPLPDKVHYYGQFFTFNDCLYRRVNRQRFLLFTDLDEFVVPYVDSNITTYLQRVTSKTKNVGAVLFKNVYFHKERGDDLSVPEDDRRVLTMIKFTWREDKVVPAPMNSKIAVVGDKVLVMHVHGIGPRWKGAQLVWADEKEALLHHYKKMKNTKPVRVERRMLIYVREVARRVKLLLNEVYTRRK